MVEIGFVSWILKPFQELLPIHCSGHSWLFLVPIQVKTNVSFTIYSTGEKFSVMRYRHYSKYAEPPLFARFFFFPVFSDFLTLGKNSTATEALIISNKYFVV